MVLLVPSCLVKVSELVRVNGSKPYCFKSSFFNLEINGNMVATSAISGRYIYHPVMPCCLGADPVKKVLMADAVVEG